MSETLTVTIEHEDSSGLARVTYECDVYETLACTITARWSVRHDERQTRRHKWQHGDRIPTTPDRVPEWARFQAADTLSARVRRVVARA